LDDAKKVIQQVAGLKSLMETENILKEILDHISPTSEKKS